jgi:hypothetical protein
MEKFEKIDFEIWIEIWKIEICHENSKWKFWNFSFLKNLNFLFFETWNENFRLVFKNWPYHQMEMKK